MITLRTGTDGNALELNTEDILNAFETYCNPRKNVVYERYKFFNIKQKEGQNINDFLTQLKIQAKHCEFGEQIDNLICDRIVCCVND